MPSRARLRCSQATAGARRGMTLVEVLLTLALLVVIGSMTAPVFFGAYATARLRSGGDLVVTQWSDARTRAIETGEVYQFRFTPESGTFVVEPWTGMLGQDPAGSRASSTASAGSTNSASTTTSGTATVVPSNSSNVAGSASAKNGTLPDEVVFQSGELAVEDALTGKRSVGSLREASGALSTPILFFPDGTTSQASVTLTNGQRQFVRVTLRGLTGVGRASVVLTEEELQRADRRK